jgi:sodium-independent sulfate anion transporter 11
MSLHSATGIGHGLAKLLGIKLNYRNPTGDPVTRGESTFSASTADIYVEQEPTAWDWLEDVFPSGRQLLQYVYNLFPFVHWISRYNLQWLSGDLVAGRLVGFV